jgi:hypothetical protein
VPGVVANIIIMVTLMLLADFVEYDSRNFVFSKPAL